MKLVITMAMLVVLWQCDAPTPVPAAKTPKTKLVWVQSTTPQVSYRVYRSQTHGGPYQQISQNVPGTMYVDNTVKKHTAYYYVVRAWDGQLESVNSNELLLRVP